MYYLWYVLFYGIFTGLQAIKLGLTRRDPLKPPKPSGYGDRPRGVPYTRGPLYATGATFTCFDGSKTILFAKVNNNYCDCPDGSDEPGTSACPDATFYCLNRGHKALIIPSSRVNDQICDCCDGSDEWNSAVDCPNICEQVGAEFREERLRQTEAAKKGYSKRAELVTEGMRILEEEKKNMETLQKQKEALNAERDVAEAKKKEAEEKEREATTKHREAWEATKTERKKEAAAELFAKLDINADGKITHDEVKMFDVFDKDNNGEVSDEEVKSYFEPSECDMPSFTDNIYDLVRDLFVNTVKGEEVRTSDFKQEGENSESLEALESTTPSASDETTVDHDGLDDDIRNEDSNLNLSTEAISDDDQIDKMPDYDEETKKLIEEADHARRELEEVDKKIHDLDDSIRKAEAIINGDFGSDHAWIPLKGKWLEIEESHYTYKIALFDRAVQVDRNSNSEISLGHWKNWTGGEDNRYAKQLYDNGLQCWNGPERSTLVIFECGEDSALFEATEPAKCEYHFKIRTPAACVDPATLTEEHDEL